MALVSVAVAGFTGHAGYAGMVYILNFPLHFGNGFYTGVKADRLKKRLDREALPEEDVAETPPAQPPSAASPEPL